jgi:large subunit ribosomal protein L23
MSSIIIKPVITEKASFESEENGKFTFIVDKRANKLQIKSAIEELYGVSLEKVRTMNYGGGKAKTKFTNKGVVQARTEAYKKAIVTVADGETIDLYSNI